MEACVSEWNKALHLKARDAGEYSPLALAYLGDAAYELAIRGMVRNRPFTAGAGTPNRRAWRRMRRSTITGWPRDLKP